ncbi:MAG: hypothetical protein AAFX51_14815 [Cyanobacteria bacterium J06636_28]
MSVNTLTGDTQTAAVYDVLRQTRRQRVSDGADTPLITTAAQQLVLVWPQLGDFDSLEYAWWLRRGADELAAKGLTVRAVGIGDRNSGLLEGFRLW